MYFDELFTSDRRETYGACVYWAIIQLRVTEIKTILNYYYRKNNNYIYYI